MAELIEGARVAVGQIEPRNVDIDSNAFFRATWTASRAAGFLEAVALMDPALANETFTHFESVAALVDRLRVDSAERSASAQGRPTDRRQVSGPEAGVRRVTVRRTSAERRTQARRQLRDRRAGQLEG